LTSYPESGFLYFFNVYGVTVGLQSTDLLSAQHLAEDFLHFRVEEPSLPPSLALYLHRSAPPYESVPGKTATVYTPRNVSFQQDGRTYIDYSGRALGILDSSSGRLRVFSEDIDLLYETGYLFLLSQLGERLDERRLHRIHAVAVSVKGNAALVLLPMGGGKSTLATHLLADPTVDFLSDDSPLVDKQGLLHAFPLRIGILPGHESGYDPSQLRTIQRMEFGPKLLLRHQHFESRIVDSAVPALLFLGRRSLSETCIIQPATRLAALRALIPNCVIGLGLFQGMEFIFNRSRREIFRKSTTAFSRLRNCIALTRKATPYTVILGRNLELNARTIREFLEQHSR
jgi:hypothetical protein